MKNPWEEIPLHDYESHMSLESVMQLQALNRIMHDQIYRYPASTILILGIAGGNGLNHINPQTITKVYGLDINSDYLLECISRYPGLQSIFIPIHSDLRQDDISLPNADIVIANLFIEYIGYEYFKKAIQTIEPTYISCVIQVNSDSSFVSDSPYLYVFDRLTEVHHDINRTELIQALESAAYHFIYEAQVELPNGKTLLRLDFKKTD